MIKTLLAQVKEFKKASFLTPVFMILEVVVETLIPLVMADMIDHGVEAGNISYLYQRGAIMALLAVAGLITGVLGADYIDQLYSDVTSLYHLDQISASETSGKADLGPLPVESKILLVSLGAVWFFILLYLLLEKRKSRK